MAYYKTPGAYYITQEPASVYRCGEIKSRLPPLIIRKVTCGSIANDNRVSCRADEAVGLTGYCGTN